MRSHTSVVEPIRSQLAELVQRFPNAKRGDFINTTDLTAIDASYTKFYTRFGSIIGHYFRTLYNLIKFIHKSGLEKTDKKFYTNLVRAQLSQHELALLFYNCLSHYGNDRFLPLVKEYELMKHLTGVYPQDLELYERVNDTNSA